MVRRFLSISFAVLLSLSLATTAFAQATPGSAATNEQRTRTGGPRKQLATIIFAGLGGAILGLSTLSFYGRPQDYLVNLPIGFGVGIIAGTAFVTYRAVTNPQELYGQIPATPVDPRGISEFNLDHTNAHGLPVAGRPMGLNLAWDF